MKKLLVLLVLFISFSSMAQDTSLQVGSEALQEKAKIITDKYVDVLGLRAKQELLFRKKVEEFLIREEKIKANSEGEDMLNKMVALKQNETAEMGDILTRIQLEKYKEVRPEIQPLARVKQ
ncbi:hypothetical protein [Rasiella sp. SM2506]|uniref:hypothetical protein n=1 Tax=Rasiella sp. SM2506 TaxID=3423914 RepID=UPI003D79B859